MTKVTFHKFQENLPNSGTVYLYECQACGEQSSRCVSPIMLSEHSWTVHEEHNFEVVFKGDFDE